MIGANILLFVLSEVEPKATVGQGRWQDFGAGRPSTTRFALRSGRANGLEYLRA
jgi:hypothetical protein